MAQFVYWDWNLIKGPGSQVWADFLTDIYINEISRYGNNFLIAPLEVLENGQLLVCINIRTGAAESPRTNEYWLSALCQRRPAEGHSEVQSVLALTQDLKTSAGSKI